MIQKDSRIYDVIFGILAILAIIILVAVSNYGCGRVAEAADVGLIWDNPTQNTDNTPLTDLRGVFVQFWSRSTPAVAYTSPVISAPSTGGGSGSVTIRGLSDGTWVFRAAAVDFAGNQSDWSNSINAALNGRPGAPTRLRFK